MFREVSAQHPYFSMSIIAKRAYIPHDTKRSQTSYRLSSSITRYIKPTEHTPNTKNPSISQIYPNDGLFIKRPLSRTVPYFNLGHASWNTRNARNVFGLQSGKRRIRLDLFLDTPISPPSIFVN